MSSEERNIAGYSTVVDAISFLVLVSLSVVLIAPLLFNAGMEQVPVTPEQTTNAALLGLINARIPEFKHSVIPPFVSEYLGEMGVRISQSDLISGLVNPLFNHMLHHRTYADLICDFAACQFYVGIAEYGASINVLSGSYHTELEEELGEYFFRMLGPAWNWRLQISWEPFVGVPLGGYADFGCDEPVASWCSDTMVTMPYHDSLNLDEVATILEPFARNISNSIELETIERNVDASFEVLTERFINVTLEPVFNQLFEWTNGFSGASRLLRLNDSLMSDTELPQEFEYELKTNGSLFDGVSLELYDFGKFLKSIVLIENSRFLKDFSANLSSEIENNNRSMDFILNEMVMRLGGRFCAGSATLSLQIWEAD